MAIGRYVTVKKPLYEFDHGVSTAVPLNRMINGHTYTIDQVRRCGIQALLDSDGANCPKAYDSSVVPDTKIRYSYGRQRLSRHQLSSNFELSSGAGTSKRTITLGIKGFPWRTGSGDRSPLDPVYTSEFTIITAFPVSKGITIGPYLRYRW